MNTMTRILLFAALAALLCSCEFFKKNDLLEEVKKDPPVAGTDTEVTDADADGLLPDSDELIADITPDVDNILTCGNGTLEPTKGEVCEKTDSTPCATLDAEAYYSGTATCAGDCKSWIVSNCVAKSSCECGNGILDKDPANGGQCAGYNEACEPTQTEDCGNLGYAAAMGTTVPCRTDCTGWDTSLCTGVRVAFAFSSPFILDSAKLGDQDYMSDHSDAVSFSSACSGMWENGATIPPDGASHQSYVVRTVDNPQAALARVMFQQMYALGTDLSSPVITVSFPTDSIPIASYTFGLAADEPKLLAYEVVDPSTSELCLKYVATGGLFKVTESEGTTDPDGGILAADSNGQALPLDAVNTRAIGEALHLGYVFHKVCGTQ